MTFQEVISDALTDSKFAAKVARAKAIAQDRHDLNNKAAEIIAQRAQAAAAEQQWIGAFSNSLELSDFNLAVAATMRRLAVNELLNSGLARHIGSGAAGSIWVARHEGSSDDLAREIAEELLRRTRPVLAASEAADDKATAAAGLEKTYSANTKELRSKVSALERTAQRPTIHAVAGLFS